MSRTRAAAPVRPVPVAVPVAMPVPVTVPVPVPVRLRALRLAAPAPVRLACGQNKTRDQIRSAEVVGARLPAHLLIDAAQQGSASRVSLTGIGELFTRGSREGACASGGAAREHAHGTLSAFPTRLNLVERAAGPRRMRTVLASSGAQLLAAEPRPPLRTARPDCGLSSCGAPGERWEMCVQQH